MMSLLVRGKYELMNEIGKGKFGVVYRALDIQCNKKVAIKFDNSKVGLLRHEATVLNYLTANKCKNTPLLYWYGLYSSNLTPCIVIPLYEYSLLQYITSTKIETIELRTLFNKMLNILQSIHNLFILHRDIKPDNFMLNNNGNLILIDFGLSSFYVDGDEEKKSSQFTGNIIYASPNVHDLKVSKAIDDIISTSYVYLFMCCGGKLHWANLNETTSINNLKIDRIISEKKIENIELNLSSNVNIDKKVFTFLRKLYSGVASYNF